MKSRAATIHAVRLATTLRIGMVLGLLTLIACSSDAEPGTDATTGTGTAGAPSITTWLGSEVRFVDAGEGNTLLATSDAFTREMSAFDRGLRLQTVDPTTEQDFLEFVDQQALDWSDEELATWQTAVADVAAALDGLDHLSLPPSISIIKTTGDDELDAAYTRGGAIVLPQSSVNGTGELELLAHELFHVASRHDLALRDLLAPIIGWSSFAGVTYPPALEQQRVTNPDAFSLSYAITVLQGATMFDAVPIIQSDVPLATIIEQANPFASFGIYLLEVDVGSATVVSDMLVPIGDTDHPVLAAVNTNYIIHPEEVLADNFAFLIERRARGSTNVPDPSVLDQIESALAE